MAKLKYQAHRGVSTDCPENTMAAFIAAVKQGYDVIELDPAITADGKIIIMHDFTLNRTGRYKDGKPFETEKFVSETSYEEIKNYDFGLWFGKEFKGEKAPLFSDVLKFAEENNIPIKIDNKFEYFPEDIMKEFLSMIENSKAKIWFTCKNVDRILYLSKRFPAAEIHYDGEVKEEILKLLNKEVGKERLTVWLPYQNENTTWVQTGFVDDEKAALVKKYARLGIWILSKQKEAAAAKAYGADIIETTGSIKPEK